MQNYYYVLGVANTASVAEIERAYRQLHARIYRRAIVDPALNERLQTAYAGYQILADPRRRWAYDRLMQQEPESFAPPKRPPDPTKVLLAQAAPKARWVNWGLLAFCLLLALDWALPLREYPHELVLARAIVSIGSSVSNPQMAYDISTPHTKFRLPSAIAHRAREGQRVTVWRTPLLRVVRKVSSPTSPDGPAPFEPYGGGIYSGPLALLPMVLLGVAVVGVLPKRPAELRVNTAVVGMLLWIVAVVLLILY
ncbi:J domain-containing protein [Hymenobacter tibetensis]|uniref:J domain-containing protein n=1 Tax=Hymenobacter tibetensis TaxID=497967 RepID=A0ABY4CV73_9BACT|nr:DnaJ domain-containing protein [Hymenobacter tibetensis]UOG73937.1 J domain-containing protein [Hymenobacter tibetensis]